ncbi:MAG: hypothetical protein OEX07_03205 [Gammaproteobacteria bacterium]|nr:hypothetical protein [Gammaproteobacteria bacterium]
MPMPMPMPISISMENVDWRNELFQLRRMTVLKSTENNIIKMAIKNRAMQKR